MKTMKKLCGGTCVWFKDLHYLFHKESDIKCHTKIMHGFHVRNYYGKSQLSSVRSDGVNLRRGGGGGGGGGDGTF